MGPWLLQPVHGRAVLASLAFDTKREALVLVAAMDDAEAWRLARVRPGLLGRVRRRRR